eukprot:TRINITY_DN6604_c0_g1_i3.p1 TRINITY_DN6604_c0_g1~~TRINITY_DN6604_c0_g1_i3.p1  ORF type:complete len:549 (+),score=109.51 TRINITY_DN6604_c0_g1_i3:61-1647(+)
MCIRDSYSDYTNFFIESLLLRASRIAQTIGGTSILTPPFVIDQEKIKRLQTLFRMKPNSKSKTLFNGQPVEDRVKSELVERLEQPRNEVPLIDTKGNILNMRTDLRTGFHNLLKKLDHNFFINRVLRRYEKGQVFLRSSSDHIERRVLFDYDYISLWPDMLIHNLAEMLALLVEILASCEVRSIRIRINNIKFLLLFLRDLKITDSALLKNLINFLSFSRRYDQPFNLLKLRPILTEVFRFSDTDVNKILTFMNFRGPLQEFISFLDDYVVEGARCSQIHELESLLKFFNMFQETATKVNSTPRITPSVEFVIDLSLFLQKKHRLSDGWFFEVDIREGSNGTVGFGGTYPLRYDKFPILHEIEKQKFSSEAKSMTSSASNHSKRFITVPAFTIDITKLAKFLTVPMSEKQQRGQYAIRAPLNIPRAEVLICGVGSNLLDIQLKFLRGCFACYVSAICYSYNNEPYSLEEQNQFAEKHNFPIVVLIKEKLYQQKQKVTVRLKREIKTERDREMTFEEFMVSLVKYYPPT